VSAPSATDSEAWRQQCSEMLDEQLRVGVLCDPGTQLACVCEARCSCLQRVCMLLRCSPPCLRSQVCARPSTKICFVCDLRFCEACTRKPHWKARHRGAARQPNAVAELLLTRVSSLQGRFGLHYPVHNSPHMLEKLGMKQLEKKRLGAAHAACLSPSVP